MDKLGIDGLDPQMDLLTLGDIAKHCQVSEKTIRRQVDAGALVASRVGSQLRVSVLNYLDWLDRIKVNPVSNRLHLDVFSRSQSRSGNPDHFLIDMVEEQHSKRRS
jgi:hypothetical protein